MFYNRGQKHDNQDNSFQSTKTEKYACRQCFMSCVSVLLVGKCVPLALLLYYILGLISFGIVRNRLFLDAILFPLEFTTTGGLEHTTSHVRILYGLYVEGVMFLFAYTATSIRRNTNNTLENWGVHYRIFNNDACKDCGVDSAIIQK